MKRFFAVLGLALTSVAFAQTLDTKVCTVYHEDKATNCFGKEKKDYPTGVLYGVSKIRNGVPTAGAKHYWNGQPGEIVATMSSGRILVSSFLIPPDFKGDLTFAVHGSDDQLITQTTYELARGPLSVSAQEKMAYIESAPAVAAVAAVPAAPAPKQKMEMDEMFIPTPHAAPAENAAAQKALDAAPVKNQPVAVEPVLKAAPAKQAAPAKRGEVVVTPPSEHRPPSFYRLARFEIHGAYVSQKDLGETGTAIGYWAPELSFTRGLGVGIRAGGTQWKEKDNDRFTAFEGDVHVSFTLDSRAGRLTFQPLVSYHAWGDLGQQVGYGGNLVLQEGNSRLSFVLGGQAWKHEGVSYQWINFGIGVAL